MNDSQKNENGKSPLDEAAKLWSHRKQDKEKSEKRIVFFLIPLFVVALVVLALGLWIVAFQ
jgi:type IV secretory pathway component VirB8